MEFKSTAIMKVFESCFCFKKDTRSLSEACMEGDVEYVKRIITNRRDAEKEDAMGKTPIISAVKSRNVSLVKYLLSIGVSDNFTTRNNWSILHEAVSTESLAMVSYILERCSISTNMKTDDGVSPIHIAVFNGDIEMLKILLDNTMYGQSSPRGKNGITPLMIATRHRDGEMMKMLYYSGASFFEKDDRGVNSIVIAKKSRILEVVHGLNVCADTDIPTYMRYFQSKHVMIDTIQSMKKTRKDVFFGIR